MGRFDPRGSQADRSEWGLERGTKTESSIWGSGEGRPGLVAPFLFNRLRVLIVQLVRTSVWFASVGLGLFVAYLGLRIYVNQPDYRDYINGCLLIGIVAPILIVLITLRGRHPTWDLDDPRKQLTRVCAYLPLLMCANLSIWPLGLALDLSPQEEYVITYGVSTATFALAPVALLARGLWRWPRPLEQVGKIRLAGVLIFSCFIVIIVGRYEFEPSRVLTPYEVALSIFVTFISATSEELVFRVMLLSYLCAVLRSPIAALVISSIVFGYFHAPFWLSRMPDISAGSWLGHPVIVATTVLLTALGLFLGVLWLRTRSLLLIGAVHTFFNAPVGLKEFSDIWG